MLGQAAAPTIILDTNVVLDWLVFADPRVETLAGQIQQGRLRWLVSPAMQDELQRVLAYEAIARRSSDVDRHLQRAAALWQALPANSPYAGPLRCRDPDDQMFIDLAIAERASWLLSRDKALLSLAKPALRHGVTVLTPQRWSQAHGNASHCPLASQVA